MIVAVVLALVLSSPAPHEKAPLKQIIEVHSETPLCTTLHQAAAQVLVGLMEDDRVIDAGQQAVMNILHNPSSGVARLQAENASLALVHNLAIIDGILADAKRFPANPQTVDERTADDIKADLLDVVTAQKRQLNEIYGMYDTAELGSMMSDFPKFVEGFGSISNLPNPDAATAPMETPPPIVRAGLPAVPADGHSVTSAPRTVITIGALEDRASDEIVRVAATCARSR